MRTLPPCSLIFLLPTQPYTLPAMVYQGVAIDTNKYVKVPGLFDMKNFKSVCRTSLIKLHCMGFNIAIMTLPNIQALFYAIFRMGFQSSFASSWTFAFHPNSKWWQKFLTLQKSAYFEAWVRVREKLNIYLWDKKGLHKSKALPEHNTVTVLLRSKVNCDFAHIRQVFLWMKS